jgi:hypothetical protein
MPFYRKKPVIIEARVYTGTNGPDIAKWMGCDFCGSPNGQLLIHTLEGVMAADIGDYVICGVSNEFYPCKPDIFRMTYELMESC